MTPLNNLHYLFGILFVFLAGFSEFGTLGLAAERPNIVYILADDMGYGDLTCLNKDSKIPTLHIDSLAKQGMRFTDAHSPASVCTPTRYGIMTGRHPVRTRTKTTVVNGIAPLVIEPGRMTVAEMLKSRGYDTAIFGKWHLGVNWQTPLAKPSDADSMTVEQIDFSLPVLAGPLTEGFDRFFGISASLDMFPYVFVENDRVTEPLTEIKSNFPARPGPAGKVFEPIDVLPTITQKAVEYIEEHGPSGANKDVPFFLYVPLNAPHTPLVPTADWQGKSVLGTYGDFCLQVDNTVGRILDALEKNGLTKETIVFFTSDNGFAPILKPEEYEAKGHFPSYIFRGYKSHIYEGGHRIPLIVRWPEKVKADTECGKPVCLTDFMRTCADILGERLPDDAAEDSFSILPHLLGRDAEDQSSDTVRTDLIHIAPNDSLAFRSDRWKLIVPANTRFQPGPVRPRNVAAKKQRGGSVELYDMQNDMGEKVDLAEQRTDIVDMLLSKLDRILKSGRSTIGPPQKNDSDILLRSHNDIKQNAEEVSNRSR